MSNYRNNVASAVSGTPGTGTITLGSAVTGAQSFSAAYGANATVDVFITDGSAWEVALGCTYTHSGTTLTRGTLEASSTGSALSLTSAAVVRVAMPASIATQINALQQMVTPGGRLTLTSGVPVPTDDVTGATTIFYMPYVHDGIVLWDGAAWRPIRFAETSLALGTLTSALPYDVFALLISGALSLELLAWTNDTTRATGVTLQDGRYCKSGDKTRLLLGTFYTTSATATDDSLNNRFISNAYNAVPVLCVGSATGSHTYATGTVREWNGGTNVTRARWIRTFGGGAVTLTGAAHMTRSTGSESSGHFNVAMNATTNLGSPHAVFLAGGSDVRITASRNVGPESAGLNFATMVQFGTSGVNYLSAGVQAVVQR